MSHPSNKNDGAELVQSSNRETEMKAHPLVSINHTEKTSEMEGTGWGVEGYEISRSSRSVPVVLGSIFYYGWDVVVVNHEMVVTDHIVGTTRAVDGAHERMVSGMRRRHSSFEELRQR